jgi:hypothetical protein
MTVKDEGKTVEILRREERLVITREGISEATSSRGSSAGKVRQERRGRTPPAFLLARPLVLRF